jgi:hypothetical protein
MDAWQPHEEISDADRDSQSHATYAPPNQVIGWQMCTTSNLATLPENSLLAQGKMISRLFDVALVLVRVDHVA